MGSSLPPEELSRALTPAAIITTVILTIVTTAIFTRLTTCKPEAKTDGGRKPFMPGYWLPFLGHAPQMAWDAQRYLARIRDRSPLGAFTLKLAGRSSFGHLHTFVINPTMVDAMLERTGNIAGEDELVRPVNEERRTPHWPNNHRLDNRDLHMSSAGKCPEIIKRVAQNVKVHIVDLITFNSYPSDQMEWERNADADIVETPDGGRFVEADLVQLVKNFIFKTANPVVFGPDLDKNFEDIPQLLSDYEALFPSPFRMGIIPSSLSAWITSWLPSPALQRAKRARRVLLSYLGEYHEALEQHHEWPEDSGVKWQDLDQVSEIIKERQRDFHTRKAKDGIDTPLPVRAVGSLALLRTMHAKSAPLTFWLLYEVLRDPVFLQQIREEIAPHVKAVQPKNEFSLGVWVPPRVTHLDMTALMTSCPRLKSAYVETLRLYTAAWSVRCVGKELTVLKGGDGKGVADCVLDANAFVHLPHGLHQTDPKYFSEPNEWLGARHIKDAKVDVPEVPPYYKSPCQDLGTIRPYGGGNLVCPGKDFALGEMMLYTALIITMYDIQPAGGKQSWPTLRTKQGAVVQHPAGQCRVRIQKRELPVEG